MALNSASVSWCALFPVMSRWSVSFALMVNDRKKCAKSCVGIELMYGCEKVPVSEKYGRLLMSTIACATVSSSGMCLSPYLVSCDRFSRAVLKALPRVMAVSSMVWWGSISRSPWQMRVMSKRACVPSVSSMWLKNGMPVWMRVCPSPSRSSVSWISVSFVFLVPRDRRGNMWVVVSLCFSLLWGFWCICTMHI